MEFLSGTQTFFRHDAQTKKCDGKMTSYTNFRPESPKAVVLKNQERIAFRKSTTIVSTSWCAISSMPKELNVFSVLGLKQRNISLEA
mmetsp:Transcript_12513/g.35537  ORF Transcript_12513/g.35537 Transcript_12513/m.35537 type:complete len:87 (-) Transcript_12513:216-476(-)